MIFKALRRLFSKRNNENRAQKSASNQYISAKDQKRGETFGKVEVSKQELEHAQANKKLTNAEEDLRYQVIEALYEGIPLAEEYKNQCVESFAKSTLSLDFIKSHVELIREATTNKNKTSHPGTRTTTKLPQRSTPDESYIY